MVPPESDTPNLAATHDTNRPLNRMDTSAYGAGARLVDAASPTTSVAAAADKPVLHELPK